MTWPLSCPLQATLTRVYLRRLQYETLGCCYLAAAGSRCKIGMFFPVFQSNQAKLIATWQPNLMEAPASGLDMRADLAQSLAFSRRSYSKAGWKHGATMWSFSLLELSCRFSLIIHLARDVSGFLASWNLLREAWIKSGLAVFPFGSPVCLETKAYGRCLKNVSKANFPHGNVVALFLFYYYFLNDYGIT